MNFFGMTLAVVVVVLVLWIGGHMIAAKVMNRRRYKLLHSGYKEVVHVYPGTKMGDAKPGMGNFTLTSSGRYKVYIAFYWREPLTGTEVWFPFGEMWSTSDGRAVIRTWLGKRGCRFSFITHRGDVEVKCTTNALEPHRRPGLGYAVFKPQWWQTDLGI